MSSSKKQAITLTYSAFIAGLCSIVYELLIATTASYFLGDSVKYFSITIGIYMAAMGLGSYTSKYVGREDILQKFIKAELVLGLLGGLSIPALYFSYAYSRVFLPFFFFFTIAIGFLIGLEIPFLTRLMEQHNRLRVNIANILSLDYLGALLATLCFPFILLPFFGVYQSSLIFGLVNMSIGFAILAVFGEEVGRQRGKLKAATLVCTLCLALFIVFSDYFLDHWDQNLYEDRIVYSEHSKYQRIILTKGGNDIRLFLNGNLQFSSTDEYRYHEVLVHVPFAVSSLPIGRVLLLGAGDGLAVRELLKHEEVEEVTLVDLDQRIIELAKKNPYLRKTNRDSFLSKKVKIVIGDAYSYLADNRESFDLIICDLPDPNNNGLARLYSKQFYKLVGKNLSAHGILATQATSPYFAAKAFWSIAKTVEAGGFSYTYPYHALVPSFGDWGFVVASRRKLDIANPSIDIETKFLDQHNFANLFVFAKDIVEENVRINMLDRPVLLNYYLRGWERYAY